MSSGNKARYAAALQDCEELLHRLQQKARVDFEVFAEVWRDMTFSLIFCGRTSEEDLLDFTDDLFLAAKSCWLPPRSSTQRLLAAYLVYGLYFKQPAKHACKFKVTKKEWLEIAEYFNFVKSHDLPEHYYMFCKMIEGDAFRFCATPYEVYLDRRTRRADNSVGLSVLSSGAIASGALEKLVTQGFFEKITSIEAKYEHTKRQLMKYAPVVATGLANVASNELGQKLRGMCLRRALDQDNDVAASGVEVPSNKEVFPKDPDVTIGERRYNLKHRKVGDKDVGEESAWSTEEDEPGEAPKAKRRRRERGYHMVKNFRQREEMRFIQKEDNYHFHSKSSRTLHNDPMHNFMAGSRPRTWNRRGEKRPKPSLEYLAKGVQFAREAKRKHAQYRASIKSQHQEQEEEERHAALRAKLGLSEEDNGQEASYVITEEQGEEISGTLSSLSLGAEETSIVVNDQTSVVVDVKPSLSPGSNLDMPLI